MYIMHVFICLLVYVGYVSSSICSYSHISMSIHAYICYSCLFTHLVVLCV